MEHPEYIVEGWPWQISGAIRAAAIGKQRTISQISRRSNFATFTHNMSIGKTTKTFGTEC